MTDLDLLKRAEAREMYRHWILTKDRAYLDARFPMLDKLYGKGASDEIRALMRRWKDGEID